MTLMTLCKAPDVFKAGVSGAPVTHWDGYDTHYTERFMGTPEKNPDGYREGSVMEHVGGLKGNLMLVCLGTQARGACVGSALTAHLRSMA